MRFLFPPAPRPDASGGVSESAPEVALAESPTSLVGAEKLSFLDGYLYRVMVDMMLSAGPEASGLYDFYRARIEQEGTALSGYDRILFEYVRSRFDPAGRRVVHAGIGLGTLACALAMGGFTIGGLERDGRRLEAARRIHRALADIWPSVAGRYHLVDGTFPTVLFGTPWIAPQTLLIFTNCGSDWTQEFTDSVIATFPRLGDVILDARLFGVVRDLPEQRRALIDRIESQGLTATPIPETHRLGAYYHHIRRLRNDP